MLKLKNDKEQVIVNDISQGFEEKKELVKKPQEKKLKDKTEEKKTKEKKKKASKVDFSKLKAAGAKMVAGSKADDDKIPNMKGGVMLFGIRNKIALCFVIPLVFMLIIGLSAYNKAESGLSQTFQDSTSQTIETSKEYIEMSFDFIESEGMKFAFDADMEAYLKGTITDPIEAMEVLNSVNDSMLSAQATNPFIHNIHVVTKENVAMLSTGTSTNKKGNLEEYKEYVGATARGVTKWIDDHTLLDEYLEIRDNDYVLAYETFANGNRGIVVVDIKASAIQEFLDGLDLGDGSIVGFVTASGKEIISEKLDEGETSILTEGQSVFFGQEFFSAINEENLQGIAEVKFNGEKYMFFYSHSAEAGVTVCALVPVKTVVSQANEIRTLTVTLIIIACIVVLFVGVSTMSGIQNNMKRIAGKFGEVAKGDLTVQVRAKGRDEFQGLAGSANNMIINTKKLVNKVSNATLQLEESAVGVEEASGVINEYSVEITNAIDEINRGMGRQSRHAQQCVELTDVLSDDIQQVSQVVEQVEALVSETDELIGQGMGIVKLLGERAKETTEVTTKVSESIMTLKEETKSINSFVETISSISSQTNLLSLNASIEAARAGEAGRGFAVVAEEIRKLADDSAQAAGQIQKNVANIDAQTKESVSSADQAQSMVALQTEAVEKVIKVFGDMRSQMEQLVQGLKDIVENMEKADSERSDTVKAVKDISDIIEETATSAKVVRDIAEKLQSNVEHLNHTADVLGDNMEELKTEISVFKI